MNPGSSPNFYAGLHEFKSESAFINNLEILVFSIEE